LDEAGDHKYTELLLLYYIADVVLHAVHAYTITFAEIALIMMHNKSISAFDLIIPGIFSTVHLDLDS